MKSLFVRALFSGLVYLSAWSVSAAELEVGKGGKISLTADKLYLHVMHDGRSIKVQRVQDPDYVLKGYFAKTARKCPPFCIHPIEVDPRVKTVGEVEVFEFMENELRDGKGLLIDARTSQWFRRGTIPGSINIPFTVLSGDAENQEMIEALQRFGVKRRGNVGFFTQKMEKVGFFDGKLKTEKWDFSNAKDLIVWCNGPACGQSPRAIKGLLGVGYPADKIYYYRGGMQMWQLWGLTVVVPQK
ncbi:rhodanese-like domain-containing protein [Candidatus Endoriftia persephonae]|jgi:rhodanese-related sulfurtransferase|nr:rhodanese-like domain-containing protein [Candidatus Endoriftia persephone]KRT56372.1 Rhodanese-like domain [endosymbiont of Ridgeia piscesae]KRT57170.1 Rhodanese-like domain-containing protein [endosymbiont of Ridgeia piscesae]USF88239.1 rhodanese-like domain-containing protein [Candidatus Endoriftia persephone]